MKCHQIKWEKVRGKADTPRGQRHFPHVFTMSKTREPGLAFVG